jgi:hypothetical protein
VTREEIFALSFEEFVLVAVKQNAAPPQDGAWRSLLWEFTRWIKARRELVRTDGYDAAKLVQIVLARHVPDGKSDPWEYHFGKLPGVDDPRAEFIDTWDKVRTPANMDALTVAWQEAQQFPLIPKRSHSPTYCQLVSLAGHLQCRKPDCPIALPVERIAEILKCERKSVTRYLKFAIKDRLLTKVSECVPHRRAAEFRFELDRFELTSGKQVR